MDVRQYACLTVGVDHLTIKRSGGKSWRMHHERNYGIVWHLTLSKNETYLLHNQTPSITWDMMDNEQAVKRVSWAY